MKNYRHGCMVNPNLSNEESFKKGMKIHTFIEEIICNKEILVSESPITFDFEKLSEETINKLISVGYESKEDIIETALNFKDCTPCFFNEIPTDLESIIKSNVSDGISKGGIPFIFNTIHE